MNASAVNTMNYEQKTMNDANKNKPNTNPIKANFRKAQMNVNSLITKDYRKNDDFAVRKNKPNSKPIPQRDTQYAIRDTRYKPSASLSRHTKNFSHSH